MTAAEIQAVSDFSCLAFVWGENESSGELPRSPSVGVALWPEVLGCDVLRWRPDEMPDVSKYSVFLVNIFHTADSTHIEQIRQRHPEAKITGMVDPPIDMVLEYGGAWMNIWRQLSMADVIGGRTAYDNQVYGALLGKPTVHLPSPIGKTEDYLPLRDLPKEDYIVTQDHGWGSAETAQNVAALALIQRATGLRVIYAAAHEYTKEYANLAGLRAEFYETRLPFWEFVTMTAKARLCVDMYARHSFGRHTAVCAMVGTPLVGSAWANAGVWTPYLSDPYYPEDALKWALVALNDSAEYERIRNAGFGLVESTLGFEASRGRMRGILEGL